MEELIKSIKNQGEYLGKGILKVDAFLNHQVDVRLNLKIAKILKEILDKSDVSGVTKILTAEVSGIPLGFNIADLFNVNLIYAKKGFSKFMTSNYLTTTVKSRTKSGNVNLVVDGRFLDSSDKVLIVDDFLATGSTSHGLANIVIQSGATLAGFGCIIEKSDEGGREILSKFTVPIAAVLKIKFDEKQILIL